MWKSLSSLKDGNYWGSSSGMRMFAAIFLGDIFSQFYTAYTIDVRQLAVNVNKFSPPSMGTRLNITD